MSHLRQLLTAASRQYVNLTLSRCSGSVSPLQNSFHTSSCKRCIDVSELIKNKEQAKRAAKDAQDLGLQEAHKNQDYVPGGEYIPSESTSSLLVDGVRFDELPRVYIKAKVNNTIISAHDLQKGTCMSIHTGGSVGFKNSKKISTVCGQTVGLAVGLDLVKKELKNVCVVVSGQGIGRLPAIKGLQLGGVNIVSITDKTYPSFSTRPRRPRRL